MPRKALPTWSTETPTLSPYLWREPAPNDPEPYAWIVNSQELLNMIIPNDDDTTTSIRDEVRSTWSDTNRRRPVFDFERRV